MCDAKLTDIFVDNIRHGHAQRGGKILHCHFSLTLR
jgi:hypothetical protein